MKTAQDNIWLLSSLQCAMEIQFGKKFNVQSIENFLCKAYQTNGSSDKDLISMISFWRVKICFLIKTILHKYFQAKTKQER